MKVYEALYCECIHESAYWTISIHRTRKGAEMAIEFHKAERIKEHEKQEQFLKKNEGELYEPSEFPDWERWDVNETELLD